MSKLPHPNLSLGGEGLSLPIHLVLPDLLAALRARPNAVLVAPPGAGKTTAAAPALLYEPWCGGEVLLLQPRRLAARAAAERIAELRGEPVGRAIGYRTRLDSRTSAATRLTVMTAGVFLNRIQGDPELAGVSAVLFDEVHERSLESDLGLALALDAQDALRPELRLVAMSATLEGERFAALLGGAPMIESAGRSFALELRHEPRGPDERVEDAVAAACRRALVEGEGSVLAFLPGAAEIARTAARLGDLSGVPVHQLHGQVEPAAQRAAVRGPERRVVLATSIAETSVTLEGVRAVVDGGLARRPRYDRGAGLTLLVTERVSRAAATQRAGRAARQGPGIAVRLWAEAATAGLPAFEPPEILETDLSGLLLACAQWVVSDPRALRFLDPPPDAAVAEARARLAGLGALDADGRPTAHGRAMAALPLPPRLAHMLLATGARGWGRTAAEVAVLLQERGLGGSDVDLEVRLRRWRNERGPRAEGARKLAARWAALLPLAGESRGEGRPAVMRTSSRVEGVPSPNPLPRAGEGFLGACVALAFPDRVAKRRDPSGEGWASVGGRGFRLDAASPLARAEWLAVAEVGGAGADARVLSAAALDAATVEALFGDRLEARTEVKVDPATGRASATRARRLGAVVIARGPDPAPDGRAIERALLDHVLKAGTAALPWSEAGERLRARAAFARRLNEEVADLSDEALRADLADWLPPLLRGRRGVDELPPGALRAALDERLGWAGRAALDRLAPEALHAPAGSGHPIDYAAEGGPRAEVRVQALFGLAEHPTVGGARRVPLTLSLLSPAGRPIQLTKDLPGFWAGSWAAVAKEMRGRYPRHPWPDDPAVADPTLRTKKGAGRR
ncbi:MAG: ATP-dependent helicase HrpB [uncultured Sphingomonadaceae bacterium]|uniref:ATP-dependent helicase HrpB n=1 Tax=uncultured Sphingomonadaceae bacterium TaxID=169976 RepID=A0A6J4S5B0_9SPHN|nr:MAG: ATP-dependent helicase HrpB [uncultured Sphingomonadaceae bacterium]